MAIDECYCPILSHQRVSEVKFIGKGIASILARWQPLYMLNGEVNWGKWHTTDLVGVTYSGAVLMAM